MFPQGFKIQSNLNAHQRVSTTNPLRLKLSSYAQTDSNISDTDKKLFKTNRFSDSVAPVLAEQLVA